MSCKMDFRMKKSFRRINGDFFELIDCINTYSCHILTLLKNDILNEINFHNFM